MTVWMPMRSALANGVIALAVMTMATVPAAAQVAAESTPPDATPDVSEPAEEDSEQTAADTPAESAADEDAAETIGKKIANENDVLERVRESEEDRDGLWEHGPLGTTYPLWQEFNEKLDAALGLRLGVSYYMLFQWASDGLDPINAASGDLDFFGRWTLLDSDDGARGTLGFNLEYRHAYGSIAPTALNDSIGSIWKTTRGFTDTRFNVNELWWDQRFKDDHVSFRVGTINPKHFFDLYRFKSQKRHFLSTPFSDSPTIAFPKSGFGGVVRLSPTNELHIVAGIADANGARSVGKAHTFFDEGEFFTALDISFTPTVEGLGTGRYSMTFWHSDAVSRIDRPSGRGFSALAEQQVTDNIVPFVRYGYADGAARDIEHLVAFGVGVVAPFGQDDDVAGAGIGWARPVDGDLRDQWGFETYYRIQVNPVVQVTPGFQLIIDPSSNAEDDVIGVFQLRVGLVY